MRILLIRHGQTDANLQARIQGREDQPLNAAGLRQAAALAERLRHAPIQAIYSSDLRRAIVTAERVAEGRQLRVAATPLLRERDFGAWEGLTPAEAQDRHPDAHAAWRDDWEHFAPPGGESSRQLRRRVSRFLDEVLAQERRGSIAVVTHTSPGRLIVCQLLGIPGHGRGLALSNCSLSILDVPNGTVERARLVVLNDTCHRDSIV